MMNILVTGGAGYIGSHAVKMLIEENHRVVVVDNLSTGHEKLIDSAATFYNRNLHDEQALLDILKEENIEAVMHFAAFSLVGESVKDPLKYYHNNTEGSRSLLSAMRAAKVDALVFSSTAAVYGEQDTMPISEDALLAPTNPYGETKLAVENMMRALSKSSDFNYVALRYFNVAGAHHDGTIGEEHDPETHLIPNVLKSVIDDEKKLKVFGDDYDTKDGSAVRDYIHVEDLIDAHIKALEFLIENKRSDVFNLGSQEGYSVLDIIEATKTVLNKDVPYDIEGRRKGDPPILIADFKKARETLGWKPEHGLRSMIASAANYYYKDDNR